MLRARADLPADSSKAEVGRQLSAVCRSIGDTLDHRLAALYFFAQSTPCHVVSFPKQNHDHPRSKTDPLELPTFDPLIRGGGLGRRVGFDRGVGERTELAFINESAQHGVDHSGAEE